ncbi:hypothetical protein [Sulfuricurvum sp.]|uniref:hypothetical protein n=1 Tax=Sulfuricurvum sp. TaxID=2025608 RepID=UPI002E3633F5|nr:hypothetical protein [Sulfuricurvum sp.]HEX5329244.1 hypothetical protein [Sulfuricurvum sp.]
MKHSFIAPRRKRLVSGELRLVLFFFTVTIAMVVGTYLFLGYKTYDFVHERETVAQKDASLKRSIEKMEEEIKVIESEAKIVEKISTDNTVMKESIRNLFDLVPEDITLSRAELEEKSLILYGTTPNKDTYEYMLHAPLRSIFNRTYTSFYPIENGWYRFVSSNYLEEETLEEGEK